MTPQLGTDGNRIVYPIRGIVQALAASRSPEQLRTVTYVLALVGGAAATVVGLLVAGYTLESPFVVLALAAAAAIAERINVQLSDDTNSPSQTEEVSIHVLPTLLAAVLFGPLSASLVGAASMLGDHELTSSRDPGRAPRLKWAAYTSTRLMGGAAMGLAAQLVLGAVPGGEFGGLMVASLVGALVGEGLEVAFVALTARVRGIPIRAVVGTFAPVVVNAAAVYAPTVALLAFMYARVSPWTLALFLVPAMAAQRLYGLYQKERQLAGKLSIANETLEKANLQFAAALIAHLEAGDPYTAGHSEAVAIYSRDIAEQLRLPTEVREKAYLCGLVHDIGKSGLPRGLLEKPGALTLEERRIMETHSAIGERILRNVDGYAEVATIVRHHHERMDGEGYPDRLHGEAIPLVSKIITVADAYNAMTSKRPYRDAMQSQVARMRLAKAVGTQFDISVVAAFEAILASNGEAYRLGLAPEFRTHTQTTSYDAAESTSVVPDVAEVA
jgi:putative nucleotidyltransferase with HDIG domain